MWQWQVECDNSCDFCIFDGCRNGCSECDMVVVERVMIAVIDNVKVMGMMAEL